MSPKSGDSKPEPMILTEERTDPMGQAALGDTLKSAPAYRRPEGAGPSGYPQANAALMLPPPCFLTMKGEVLEYAPPQRIRVRFPVDEAWLNPYGVLQGGLLVAMFDNVIGMCAYAHDPARQSATLEVSTRFFRSVRAGHLVIDGNVLRAGRTTVTVECVAWDDAREMCAKITATNMFVGR